MRNNTICAVLTLTEEAQSLNVLTRKRPIAALPFASRYRLIDFALSSISAANIKSLGLFIGKSGRSIYDHIRSGKPWDLDSAVSGGVFTFSQQFYKYSQGLEVGFTADFYEDLVEFTKRSRAEYVFVAGSKVLAAVDIEDIRDEHRRSGDDITQVVNKHGFKMNMYVLKVELLLKFVEQAIVEQVYLEADELVRYYLSEVEVNDYTYTGFATSIDTLQAYYKANMSMLNLRHFNALLHTNIPIITKDKNGAPTFYTNDAVVKKALIATDCSIHGEVDNSVIFRRVTVGKGAKVSNSVVMQECTIEDGAIIEYAILDKDVHVKSGAVIKGTPEEIVVISRNETIDVIV